MTNRKILKPTGLLHLSPTQHKSYLTTTSITGMPQHVERYHRGSSSFFSQGDILQGMVSTVEPPFLLNNCPSKTAVPLPRTHGSIRPCSWPQTLPTTRYAPTHYTYAQTYTNAGTLTMVADAGSRDIWADRSQRAEPSRCTRRDRRTEVSSFQTWRQPWLASVIISSMLIFCFRGTHHH